MPRLEKPPRDSWVLIKAGQGFAFDLQAMGNVTAEMARFGREFRGTLLASAYEIESILDVILLGVFFPGSDTHLAEQRKLFDEELLKRGNNFAKKIKLLSTAREAIAGLEKVIPEETITKLHRARLIRNDCAHYPVSLVPDGADPITKFKAFLCGAEKDTELSAENVTEIYQFFGQLTHDLNDAARVIGEGALTSAPNPPRP